MSSGMQKAQHNFPSGEDIFGVAVDRGIVISGESHVIPSVSPFQLYLDYVPLQIHQYPFLSPNVFIPGYNETFTSPPGTFGFVVNYSGLEAGLVTFNALQSGLSISVEYTTYGDIISAFMVNDLSQSIDAIETYVLNLPSVSGSYLTASGGTISGQLLMNGNLSLGTGNIISQTSGINTVGTNTKPMSNVFSNSIQTNSLQSPGNMNVLANGNLTLSGNSNVYIQGNLIPQPSGIENLGSASNPWDQLYIEALASSLVLSSGINILVSAPSSNNIGSPTSPIGNLYATNITSPSIASGLTALFVQKAGDTMFGTLTIASGNTLNTYTVTNSAGNLTLSSAGQITINNNIIPNASGTLNLGSASNPINTVYAQNISTTNLSGNFVNKNGDTMNGDLNFPVGTNLNVYQINSYPTGSGSINIAASQLNINSLANTTFNISSVQMMEIGSNGIYVTTSVLPTQSGLYNLGAPNTPYNYVYANNLVFGTIQSGVNVSGAIIYGATIAAGSNIVSAVSGDSNIGSPSEPIGTIYANNIVTLLGSGTYLSVYGGTLNGNYVPSASGLWAIGSPTNPLSGVYANNLEAEFVHKSGDVMSGPLSTPLLYNGGTLVVSGNITDIYGQQMNLQTLNGAIIINANTEIALLNNGVTELTVTSSGILSYNSSFPNISGNYTLGTPQYPYGAVYANAFFSPSSSGAYVLKAGDKMSGPLYNNVISNNGAPYIYISGSVAEGLGSSVSGANAHAEGIGTIAFASGSHSEGWNTNAGAVIPQLFTTITIGNGTHAEGSGTYANADFSHVEGVSTITQQNATSSHAEGWYTFAVTEASHAEGSYTTAGSLPTDETPQGGSSTHAEGYYTNALGPNTHAEGSWTSGIGYSSHVEGMTTVGWGSGSHAQGINTVASGNYSFAGGQFTNANGFASVALAGWSGSANASGSWFFGDANQQANSINNIPNSLLMRFSGGVNLDPTTTISGTNAIFSNVTVVNPNATEDPFYRYNQQPLLHYTNNYSTVFSTYVLDAANYGTWDGEYYWSANYSNSSISQINQNGTVVNNYTFSEPPLQLAWDGQYIWVGCADVSGTLIQFNPTTATTISTNKLNPSASGAGGIQGLVWDGINLWAGVAQDGYGGEIIKLSSSGTALVTISGQTNVNGMVVTDLINSGTSTRYIWGACTGFISKINVSNNTYQTFTTSPATSVYRLCSDGVYIYGCDFGTNVIFKYLASNGSLVATWATVTNPNSIAFDGENIWVAGNANKVYIHERNNGTILTILNNNISNGLVFDGTYMWGNGQAGSYPLNNGFVSKMVVSDIAGNSKFFNSLSIMNSGNTLAYSLSSKNGANFYGNNLSGVTNINLTPAPQPRTLVNTRAVPDIHAKSVRLGSPGINPSGESAVCEGTYTMCVSGS